MLHAHVQIQYGDCESLIGFNPENEEDRKLVHNMLDEFLDEYLIPLFKNGKEVFDKEDKNYLKFFGDLDNH